MPIYEYRCPNGHTFELFQRMSDPPPAGCQVCDAAPVEKVLYPAAIHFKGSGFYSTDYGKRKTKADGRGEGGDGGSGGDAKGADAKDAKSSDGGSSGAKADTAKPSEAKSQTKASKAS